MPTIYALLKTASDNESDYSEEVASTVRNNFYVNGFCTSVEGVQEGKVLMIMKQFSWYIIEVR